METMINKVLTDNEIKAFVQDAIRSDLTGNGLSWLVDQVRDAVDNTDETDEDILASFDAGVEELVHADEAVVSGDWPRAHALLNEASDELGDLINVPGRTATELEKSLDWAMNATYIASLDRGGMDWRWWLVESTDLSNDPWYDGDRYALETWEDEDVQLTISDGHLAVIDDVEGEEDDADDSVVFRLK